MRPLALALGSVLALAACKADAGTPPAVAAVAADGSRQIAIKVDHKGYTPAKTKAKAGEALTLVFTRTEDVACGQYVKVPGTPGQTELPVGKAVPVKLTMPTTGELVFTCGMDMFRGVIAVAP
jgi:plastocyanin domain-containing protein